MDLRRILDKTVSGSFWKQIVFAIAFTVGIFGFFAVISLITVPDIASKPKTREPSAEQCNPLNHEIKGLGTNRYWALLSQFLDPGNIDKAEEEHRILTSLVAIAGSVTLGGLLIATLSNILERRVDRIKNGDVRYRLEGHIVIVGYDPYAVTIIKNCVSKHKARDIVLFTSQSPVDVLKHLSTFLDKDEEKKLIMYHGGRDSLEQIKTLGLHAASSLYIFGEAEEPERDSMNLHCFKLVRDHLASSRKKTSDPLPCHVLLQHHKEFQLAQEYDLQVEEKTVIKFLPLNFHEEWSRIILSDLSQCMVGRNVSSTDDYLPIPSEQLHARSTKHLHLIIIGFDEMGKVFAAHAMRVLHFPNLSRSRITIIDPNVIAEFERFSSHFPGYKKIDDISFSFLPETPFSETTRSSLDAIVSDDEVLPYIVICLPESDCSLAAGLNLPLNVYQKKVPVLVRYNEYHGISTLLHKTATASQNQKYANVRFWGMPDRICFDKPSLALRETFAESAHNAYLQTAKELKFYDPKNENNSEFPLLKSAYQWANRYLADSYLIKLMSAGLYVAQKGAEYDTSRYQLVSGFDAAVLDQIAESEHARWVAERVINGWVYGAKRDNNLKIHHNIAPWEQIGDDIRQYDYALVRNMIQDLAAMGYTVVRKIG
ncbi:RyR domain-containing protein [Chlorobium limicola]|uniref:Ryanodine receptor Ryr domain-containing protein n=1 Tax=Chlorobium limicola TaxID=1092 RepID=A0A101J7X7_CHLLI|nr:RyR domain-containing protein [Chlorobium limicola]KUL21863.1 hypothetical protein ASB62_07805 [Chlorobium limicola]